jgi:D-sedoheptulose 7-phosphate isomerase
MPKSAPEFIAEYMAQSVAAMQAFAASPTVVDTLQEMADAITACMRNDRKLLIAGNGGSAGDSQHIAAEFVSRLMYDRAPLPALALTVDSSALTAIGNDYGYDHVFERQVLGLGNAGDIFLGISTSGKSRNVLRAFEAAKTRGVKCFGFAGANGGPMRDHCDILLEVPAGSTAVVQQLHITAGHILCALIEREIFPHGAV